jgi:hypothetical protein
MVVAAVMRSGRTPTRFETKAMIRSWRGFISER